MAASFVNAGPLGRRRLQNPPDRLRLEKRREEPAIEMRDADAGARPLKTQEQSGVGSAFEEFGEIDPSVPGLQKPRLDPPAPRRRHEAPRHARPAPREIAPGHRPRGPDPPCGQEDPFPCPGSCLVVPAPLRESSQRRVSNRLRSSGGPRRGARGGDTLNAPPPCPGR